MKNKLITKTSININANPAKVWEALINPEKIKQYLFGTDAISDWKTGSSIIYKGVWEGKAYEDKGTILKIVPEKLLQTSYWSGFSGLPDVPENYKKITYELFPEKNNTKLTITQDNNSTEEEKNHSEQNWKIVLDKLKTVVENQ